MATAHSLSMVTNSCVTRPRNPKTNLPETTLESEAYKNNGLSNGSFAGSNSASKYRQNGREYFAQSHTQRNDVGGTNTWEEDALIDKLTNDVENITSDEFYERLRELKDKHRVTLSSLEARYNQKLSKKSRSQAEFDDEDDVAGDGHGYVDDWNLSLKYMNGIDEVKGMTRSGPVYVAEHKHKHLEDEVNRFNQSLPAWSALPKDNVRDMSSKPPSGRPVAAAWTDRPPSRSKSRAESKSKPKPDWTEVTWSSDGECSATTEEIISSVNASLDLSLSKQPGSPAVVVDNMWDDFSVDSYAPRSRSMSRSSARSNSTQNTKSKEWSPKITIPKPFTMTVRESSEERKKSRAAMELDQERLEREKQEEVECQRKFKAQPVPAHTFLPLYEELIDQQVERSRKNKEVCKEKLLTTQKPFKLTESKTPPRPKSAFSTSRKVKQFKAKPVPKSVFDPTIDDQILEEEEYRKIRIKMRAEEMLRQSSLPPNMQIRGKEYTDGKMRMKMMKSREKKAFLTTDHKFRPQVNGEIPDYDELYRRFQEEVHEKKREKEPTVFEPFNLRTARIPSRKGKIMAEMEEEERRRRESLRGSLSKSASLRRSIDSGDSLPSKTTTANELRKSATLKTMMSQAQKEKMEQEKEQRQRYKQRKLAKSIADKARANDTSQSLETTNLEKIRQHKLAERAREEEYQRELQEMMARIESRPLLFERERELNAKKRAERKYESALRSAGISEDFLERKGRGGVGAAASTSYASDRGEDNDDKSDASYNYDKDYDDDDDDFGRSSSEASET